MYDLFKCLNKLLTINQSILIFMHIYHDFNRIINNKYKYCIHKSFDYNV